MLMDTVFPSHAINSVAAGPFGEWLAQARESLRGNGGADVPCGDCIGCCTSSYLIQVRPEDKESLGKIPAEMLTFAHGFPPGHMVMIPRSDGACPMLHAGKCSIYRQRPQTCLDYDCRIFAAAGIDAGGADKTIINQRVREWQFTYGAEADRAAHRAVQSAASFIKKMSAGFPGARMPMSPTGIAVMAIKVYAVFLSPDLHEKSEEDIAATVMDVSREFDEGSAPMAATNR